MFSLAEGLPCSRSPLFPCVRFSGKSAGEAVPPAARMESVGDLNHLEDLCGGWAGVRAAWMQFIQFSSCGRFDSVVSLAVGFLQLVQEQALV